MPRRLLPNQSYGISLHDAAQYRCLHIQPNASAARLSLKSIAATVGAAASDYSQYFVRDGLTPSITGRVDEY